MSNTGTSSTPDPKNDNPIIVPRLTDPSEIEIKPIDWLWNNKIPYGDISVITGLQKLGKSMMTIYMAKVITRGQNWCDGSLCEMGSVLFFAGEDRADEYARRLKANGADLSKVRILDGADMLDPNSGTSKQINVSITNIDVIDAAIAATEKGTGLPTRMVVIDPISNYWGGVNEKDNTQVRSALHPLQQFFQKRRTALVLIQHFTKAKGKKAMLRVQGSVAVTGTVRTVWGVYKDSKEHGLLESQKSRYFLHVGSNYCVDPMGLLFRITPDKRVDIIDTQITMDGDDFESGESPEGGMAPALRDAKEWLENFLSDGRKPSGKKSANPGTVRYEAEAAGHSWGTIRRAADSIGIVRATKSENGAYYWHMPELKNNDAIE
jgi:putative DNA primase/helicase